MADPNTRQGKRTPVTLKIKFKSETIEQFIERYAVDVSQGGIFIRTKEPLAVGTQMKFEFQLRDASPLIAGEGTVVWTRENDPSRPAIAPGMGVRFDRLADGSQSVLEKILAEKAKQAPPRALSESKQSMFSDTPTRVAPAAVQDALGLRSRSDSELTPLPKPMPFHSDADEFDSQAFDEATKVRSLEELAAQSAFDDDSMDGASASTRIFPPDQLDEHRNASRADATLTDRAPSYGGSPFDEPVEPEPVPTTRRGMPDRDSAPGLPSPPVVDTSGRAPRLDTTPTRSRPITNRGVEAPPSGDRGATAVAAAAEPGRTRLGMEPAKVPSSPRISTPESLQRPGSGRASAPSIDVAVPQARGPEPSRPIAPQRPSSAPIVIGILVIVAAAIAAVWWFVLREKVEESVADKPTGSAVAGSGSADTGSADTGSADTGSADTGSAGTGSDTMAGSGSDTMAGSGAGSDASSGSGTGSDSDTGSATVPTVPAGPTVNTVITAAKGATIEVLGTDQKGTSPLTATLEKGKTYKARVTAPGFVDAEVDVTGGQRATAKLVLKPRVISVTSDPPGASIYIDGVNTQQLAPADVALTASQAARTRVRVSLRRPGYKQADKIVSASEFSESGGKMTAAIEVKLSVYVRPAGGSSGGTTNNNTDTSNDGSSGDTSNDSGTSGTSNDGGTTGTGSSGAGASGTGSGSAKPPSTGTGSGSAKPPGVQPPATSLGGGTTPLRSEPEPVWTK